MRHAQSQPEESLKPITIRISVEAYNTVTALADEFNVKKADILRLAIDSSLEKYLGRVQYIDVEQAKTINHNIIIVGNVMVDIRDQLRRIGVNYNREIRLRNAERKKRKIEEQEQSALKNRMSTTMLKNLLDKKDAMEKEIQNIKNDIRLLDKNELDLLIQRVEKAVDKAGKLLRLFK